MKAYPEYKSSGIDWLGEIPSHWETNVFKWMFSTSTGITFTKADLVEKGNAVISYGQIHSDENTGTSVKDSLIRFIPDSLITNKENALLNKGNFLFADTSEDLEGCGNCVYIDADFPIYAGYHSIMCKPTIEVVGKYLAYLFKTDEWRSQIRSRVYGVKVFSVTQTILAQTSIILPPLSEQQAIADFLDEKTAKVDALMEEKKKQVEDLRAYRTSLITETVTRGLNPDVPLRPSGIDWLGEIPQHWETIKIKFLSDLKSGTNITSDDITKDGYPVYGGNGQRGYYPDYNHEGDYVLIGRQGALCGNINYANGKFWATEHAVVCHPLKDYAYRWFGELLRIMNLNQYSLASAQPGLSVERIKNLTIPVPPRTEQQAIAAFLDEKTWKIAALINELTKQLDELAEYKKAVISEAVTGKVDVRDWKTNN